MRIASAFLAFSVLAGCASNPAHRELEQLATYRAHAGAPVDRFHYLGRMSHWTALGPEAVAIWTSPTRAYLLEVDGPCNDLAFAQAIRLSASTGMVHARFDDVTPLGTGIHPSPCRIREIRPLDVPALKAAQRATRAAR
jgi:hypothetical protein